MAEQPPRTRARKKQPPLAEVPPKRARKRGGPGVKAAMASGAVARPVGRGEFVTDNPLKKLGIVQGTEGDIIPLVAWRVQCHYINPKNDKRCERPAIRGGYRCATPGHGNSPARAAAARERLIGAQNRLLEMVPGAMERIEKIICEGTDEYALKAALGVLDRIGLGPKATLDVSGHISVDSPAKQLAERLQSMHDRSEHAQAAVASIIGDNEDDGTVVDAEIVEIGEDNE